MGATSSHHTSYTLAHGVTGSWLHVCVLNRNIFMCTCEYMQHALWVWIHRAITVYNSWPGRWANNIILLYSENVCYLLLHLTPVWENIFFHEEKSLVSASSWSLLLWIWILSACENCMWDGNIPWVGCQSIQLPEMWPRQLTNYQALHVLTQAL